MDGPRRGLSREYIETPAIACPRGGNPIMTATGEKPPEIELLLNCARTVLPAEQRERIRAIVAKGIDWPDLIHRSIRHGLLPLLHRSLAAAAPDLVPPEVRQRLHHNFMVNCGRNLLLAEELFRLLDLFAANGIPAIPFKGPVLAAAVYGDLALRTFVDLDIFVRRQDVSIAKNLLLSRGYLWPTPLSNSQERAYLRFHADYPFSRRDHKVSIELHWRVTPREFPLSLRAEDFWQSLEPVRIEGRTVSSLSPENLLLFLIIHGAKHGWKRLQWTCDVAELIRARQIDWPRMMGQAGVLHCRRIVGIGLSLAADLLQAPLPPEVRRDWKNDPAIPRITARTREDLFSRKAQPEAAWEEPLFYLAISERFLDRAGYCCRLAFTPTLDDWAMMRLPFPLSPLYYLLHPIRLLGKAGKHLLNSRFSPPGGQAAAGRSSQD
jgi:hypothetical protein